ncbi:MAG: hypothetical protein AAGA20_16510 [Planctomycetota bacterium]
MRTRATERQPSSKGGRVPTWVPLALLFAGLFAGLQALQDDARSRGLARIDATRYRLHADVRWGSAAWDERLERLLLETREIPADDGDAIRAFVRRVEELPFVAAVGTPEAHWPDGLTVPVKLHEPVACIRVGGRDFLPVAPDGTLLDGYARTPHPAYGGYLPTLAPHGLLEEVQGPVEPGDRIEVPALRSALLVAETLWDHLDVDDLRDFGRATIDASRADAPVFDRRVGSTTPRRLPGGVVVDLEFGRRVLFGRPPEPVVEGELPVGYKWQHVRKALEASRGGDPWSLLDARFDAPVLMTKDEVLEFEERWESGADEEG